MNNKIDKTVYDEDEIQIDLLQLFYAWKHRLWVIILAAILLGAAAGAYTKLVMTPVYSSQAMMYILSKETTLTSLADLQIGSQLTKDYTVMVTSRPVLQKVVDELKLNSSYRELRSRITINNPADTRILSITVTDPDPVMAKNLADKVAQTASDYIGDIMEMVPPKMVEDAEVPDAPTSPNIRKNIAMGAMAGAVLVCGVVTLTVIMDDTIKTEEDVERYLGTSVLASIPVKTDNDKSRPAPKGKSRRKR